MALSPLTSAASTDLGLDLQNETKDSLEQQRKKRLQQIQEANKVGMTGGANAAYMSLTGNQY